MTQLTLGRGSHLDLLVLRHALHGRAVAILANASSRNAVQEMDEVQAAARTLGVDAVAHQVRRAEDIAPAFEAFKGRAQALYVVIDPLTTTNGARTGRLPRREYARACGVCA